MANEAGKSLVKFNTIEELIGETLAVQKIKYMLAAKVKSKCRLSALQGTQKPLKNAASRYKSVPLEAGNRITEHLGIILS